MSRVLHGIERGIRIYSPNSDTAYVDMLFGSAAPGGDAGEQDAAPVGSIYQRTGTGGGLYKKVADNNVSADWEEVGNVALDELVWRSERVVAATNDTLSAGSGIDPTSWTDNDSGVDATNWVVGDYVLGDVDGTPALFEITAKASATSITLTAASIPLADNNTFVVQSYLPDPGASQEAQAIIHFPSASAAGIKISDFNWAIATGINLSGGYVGTTNGTVAAGDTVEQAISKLDANQKDLTTLSGVAQGAVDLGTFTGDIIADNDTVKQALQDLETELVDTRDNADDLITLSGVAENATDLGTFTGTTIPDNQTIKQALQSLESAVESGITYSANGVTTATAIDQVLVDVYAAAKWYVYIREAANPSRVKAYEVFATHDGTSSADATQVDDTAYSKLKIGSDFNATLSVELSGTGASQYMQLKVASSTAGVDVRVVREAVQF